VTPDLQIDDYSLDGRTHCIELAGPLDLHAAPGFKDSILGAIEEGKTRVIVDLSAVTFIDSAALSVFVRALRRIRAAHGFLALIVTDYDIERVFEITGIDRVVAIHRSRDAALAELSEAGNA
jgi:anti-sigma B factor antagonist